MIWNRVRRADGTLDPWYVESDCRRFSVSKVICNGATRYECWRLGTIPGDSKSVLLGRASKLLEAQAFATLELARLKAIENPNQSGVNA